MPHELGCEIELRGVAMSITNMRSTISTR